MAKLQGEDRDWERSMIWGSTGILRDKRRTKVICESCAGPSINLLKSTHDDDDEWTVDSEIECNVLLFNDI